MLFSKLYRLKSFWYSPFPWMTFQCYVTCSMGGSINTKFRCASFQGILNYELPINHTASERSCSCIPLCYTHTCTCTHTHMGARTRAHTRTRTHAHTRARTHTHTRARNDKRVAIYTDSKITLDLLKNNFKRNRLIEYITYLLTYSMEQSPSWEAHMHIHARAHTHTHTRA